MPNPMVTSPPNEPSLKHRIDQLDRELATTRHRLEHAQRLAALGTSAAGLAHEINNILTPVLAYAQLAQASPDDPELLRKAVHKAADGVVTATELVSSLLDFARPATDPADHAAEIVDGVKRAMQCLIRDPAKDGITVNLHIDEAIYVQIRPLALQQVILNLLLNSIKALRTMQIRLRRIMISAHKSDDATVVIRISDTGPGIPPAISRRLFEPFVHQDDEGGDESSGGEASRDRPGLGLAICRMLIEQAGGSIAVTTAPDRGTTFTIELVSAQKPSNSPHIAA